MVIVCVCVRTSADQSTVTSRAVDDHFLIVFLHVQKGVPSHIMPGSLFFTIFQSTLQAWMFSTSIPLLNRGKGKCLINA